MRGRLWQFGDRHVSVGREAVRGWEEGGRFYRLD